MKYLVSFYMILTSISFCNEYIPVKKRILVGSPIRQKPAILKEFLQSLEELDRVTCITDYFFIDDNENLESSSMLHEFAAHQSDCMIADYQSGDESPYICDETTHVWEQKTVWKVAAFKDWIFDYARRNIYDYVFLIDSDIVLHKATLEQLISADKDIISEIFWTKWYPEMIKTPQVWLTDEYNQFELKLGEHITSNTQLQRLKTFLNRMSIPGIYEVGGLGACTLINKCTLNGGISFKKLKNITFWGEDRHFCIRAIALGFSLFVDTHYPAYHIYRESDLVGVAQFKENCRNGIYQI